MRKISIQPPLKPRKGMSPKSIERELASVCHEIVRARNKTAPLVSLLRGAGWQKSAVEAQEAEIMLKAALRALWVAMANLP